jgi:small subunit ribosomal protein S8
MIKNKNMINDPISDLIIRITNAYKVKHKTVLIPYSKLIKDVLIILKQEQLIQNIQIYKKNFKVILISLKYKDFDLKPLLNQIVRVSKPGLRIYCNKDTLPNISNNLGVAILSTSKGIMTNKQAKRLNIGGEILCYIL